MQLCGCQGNPTPRPTSQLLLLCTYIINDESKAPSSELYVKRLAIRNHLLSEVTKKFKIFRVAIYFVVQYLFNLFLCKQDLGTDTEAWNCVQEYIKTKGGSI